MILEIDDTKTTTDVQDRFSLCYPSLKLAFCRRRHGWEKVCRESDIIYDTVLLAQIRKVHEPGTIEVKSWSKVGAVEKEFRNKFGLNVQILYKSGDTWIQTGKSDNVTIDFLLKRVSSERRALL